MFNTAINLLMSMVGIALLATAFAIIVAVGAYLALCIIIHIITVIKEEL